MEVYFSEARKKTEEKLRIKEQLLAQLASGEISQSEFERKIEDFIITDVPISLVKVTPTPIDHAALTKSLNDMGLTCDYTRGEGLQECIDRVHSGIQFGKSESFGIEGEDINSTVYGDWKEGNTSTYQGKLLTLIKEPVYSKLKEQFLDFPCAEMNNYGKKDNKSTVDAVIQMFVECAEAASSTVVQGLNKTSMDATFANMLGINSSDIPDHYKQSNYRNLLLVLNYTPDSDGSNTKGHCDGVGVLHFEFEIEVTNYKEKKSSIVYTTTITVNARSLLYTDVDLLMKHYREATK